MTSKRRAELRAEAHRLDAIVHAGQHGVTDGLFQSIDDALRTRELVKIQLGRKLDSPIKETAHEIARVLEADVVQVIGHTATLYRENPELPRKPGAAPPWRR